MTHIIQYHEHYNSGFTTGIYISAGIIIIWLLWSIFSYKYSSDRLGSVAVTKYQSIPQNASLLDSNSYFAANNLVVSQDKSYMTVDIELRDKTTQAVKQTNNVKYTLSDSCSLANLTTCIAV